MSRSRRRYSSLILAPRDLDSVDTDDTLIHDIKQCTYTSPQDGVIDPEQRPAISAVGIARDGSRKFTTSSCQADAANF